MPEPGPTKGKPIPKDATLFVDGVDIGLSAAVWKVVTELMLSKMLSFFKRGGLAFVVGQVGKNKVKKALTKDLELRFADVTLKVPFVGVQRKDFNRDLHSHPSGTIQQELMRHFLSSGINRTSKLPSCTSPSRGQP